MGGGRRGEKVVCILAFGFGFRYKGENGRFFKGNVPRFQEIFMWVKQLRNYFLTAKFMVSLNASIKL